MKRISAFFGASFLGGWGLLASTSVALAAPQQPVGSAIAVVNLVTAEYNRDTRSLQTGDRVHQDETIEVGSDGSSELKLEDDTKLALGPGSHLTLDKFVYDAEKAKGSIILDLVKGSFRFMTGVAEKPTYVIKTPAAAITVRGTVFDVYVQDDGLSWLLLHEGAVQICNQRGQCRVHDEPGKLIRITSDGDVGVPVKWASLPGNDKVPFDNAFPFVAKAPGIDPQPVFTRDAILLGTYPTPDKPKRKTETTKPTKRVEKTPPPDYEKKPKKTRTAKSKNSDDDNIVSGMDIAIGIGGGLLNKRGGHKGGPYGGGGGSYGGRSPGGNYPRGMTPR